MLRGLLTRRVSGRLSCHSAGSLTCADAYRQVAAGQSVQGEQQADCQLLGSAPEGCCGACWRAGGPAAPAWRCLRLRCEAGRHPPSAVQVAYEWGWRSQIPCCKQSLALWGLGTAGVLAAETTIIWGRAAHLWSDGRVAHGCTLAPSRHHCHCARLLQHTRSVQFFPKRCNARAAPKETEALHAGCTLVNTGECQQPAA